MKIEKMNRGRSIRTLLLLSMGSGILFNHLFYGLKLGINLPLYVAFLGSCLLYQRPPSRNNKSALKLLGLFLVLLLSLLREPGSMNAILSLGTLTLLPTFLQGTTEKKFLSLLRRLRKNLRICVTQWHVDLPLLCRLSKLRKCADTTIVQTNIRTWKYPIGMAVTFLGLFAIANPIIAQLLTSLWTTFVNFLKILLPEDFMAEGFMIFLGVIIGWGLLRLRDKPLTEKSELPRRALDETGTIIRCLLLSNLIFALESVLDISYLFLGRTLPEGMNYAEYAHRGAYPLVGTTLLAALFVLLTFSEGSKTESNTTARKLVFLWIGQNILLLASTSWRLFLYIETYSLTELRLATVLWIGLLAFGFLSIGYRIFHKSTNESLIRQNAVATLSLLLACSFLNLRNFIAQYNIEHCLEMGGTGPSLDLPYLSSLGFEALPAVREFSRQTNTPESREELRNKQLQARMIATCFHANLEMLQGDWRQRSWLRSSLLKADNFSKSNLDGFCLDQRSMRR